MPGLPVHPKICSRLLIAAAVTAPLAHADSPKNPQQKRVIEEVIVSAQKRDEAIQDVPISMSVMDAKFMTEQGVTDLREALLYVPNVQVEQAGFFAAPRARGFTFNNNNKAFEPPLGFAVDGVPYTRIPYFLAATFDLKRIEVLRGPQGTTFGKNTTAGLIHIMTQDPGEEFEAALSVQGGEFERERYEASISMALPNDALRFRLAGFDDKRDGFVENTSDETIAKAQTNFRGHDRDGYRFKIMAPDLFGTQLKISWEEVNLTDIGTGFEIIRANEEVKGFLRTYDPNVDFEKGNYIASLDDRDGRSVHIETLTAELSGNMGEWGWVLVGGHSLLEQELALDTDFTPAPAIFGLGGDSSPTTTAEFRIISPDLDGFFGLNQLFGSDLGRTDFVAGVFWQKREINDSYFRFIFDMPAFLGLTSAAGGSDSAEAGLLLSMLPNTGEGDYVEDVTQNFNQSAESIAAFAEFKWHFAQDWTFQLGMRQGVETKEADWKQFYNQPQPAVILPQAGLDEFEAERSQRDEQFQHKVSLNWQPADNLSFFIHRAEGVKGGGFNAFAFRNVEDELTFKPEYTTEWSLNAKTTWLDNTLKANVSLFRMDVEDFQVLSRDPERTNIGIGVTLVKNAADARSQGVEGDFTWLPNSWLTLIGTLGFNETEYIEFVDNECPPDRSSEPNCGDASGKSFPFAPEWNNTLTAIVSLPVFSSDVLFNMSATVEQISEQFLDLDLDERKVQEGFERYKASVGFSNPVQGWSFKIIGENLTNEQTGIRQGDLFSGVFVEITEQPRLIYGQFNWEF
ncbi:TonB-dependent receptor [Spongiibacter sp. KMU-166]|uniref:TonB-dependent receptor n=1 Tax=Spongiibacter thalassae TaxID=2721624 RepID=A0ABX1GGD7_9GAMM|nr:TonB-dependent receptor [Spongiibacter thalassae]NKI18275.1 TonB-dependent receptor [Spongiibacter thalassae]